MAFVIGLLIGLVLGAAIAYFLTTQKATTLSASVQDLKRQLALAESEHERRLREATEQLRQDYAAQPPTATKPAMAATPATNSSVTSASPAAASAASEVAGPPPASVTSTEPLPTPTPKPVEVKPAVTPAAAPPKASLANQSSTVTSPKPPTAGVQAASASVQLAHPNDVLAASYAPDVSTRQAVVQAIAAALPTSGAPAQARWLPILGRLARDAAPTVRLSAIQALEHVTPSKRLPLLRRALQDPDPAVVRAASTIINQTKGHAKSPQASKKRRLPKNK